MTIILVAGLILLVLVASVMLSSASHKREQEAAERRQRAAEYRARVHECQELLDGLQNAGLDASVRAVLMQRIADSLSGLQQCEPDAANLESSLKFAKEQATALRSQAGTASPVVIPDNEPALVNLLKHMRRLVQMFSALNQTGRIDASLYAQQFPQLQHLLLKFEVEGYMKLSSLAAGMGQPGTARTYLEFAHNRLIASAVTDDYTQQQLINLQALMDRIGGGHEAETETINPEDEAAAEKSAENDVFQPKKKW